MASRRANFGETLLTAEQYQQLPDDPHFIDELSKGRLVREPRPGARHGRIAFRLAGILDEFVRSHDLGSIEMECGFQLANDIVRGPDVAFIARSRLPAEVPTGWWPFAPDLAIEVVSPSNRASEIDIKILEYLDAGARMVWVIDPQARTARIHTGKEARIVREEEELRGGDVVPNFSIPLRSILF